MQEAHLSNPKQNPRAGNRGWYRYYAGYSSSFVRDALRIAGYPTPHVLDPWVGAGTSAAVAAHHGLRFTGVDINPVLVVVAKARLLRLGSTETLEPLTAEIIDTAHRIRRAVDRADPLLAWFTPDSAATLRSIERSIGGVLISQESATTVDPHELSSLAAFFYVALFLVTRSRLRSATTSNPTWIKSKIPLNRRARPSEATLFLAFRRAQASLSDFPCIESSSEVVSAERVEIQHGSSTSLNVPANSVDIIITSPPYCTRIDYVAGRSARTCHSWL